MISHMGLHENLKVFLWPECEANKNKLENIMVNPHEEICAYEKFCGRMPDSAEYLKQMYKWELYSLLPA